MLRKLVLAYVILGMAAAASADVLHLKNGNAVHGTIVRKTDSAITMKLGTLGEMVFKTDEIESVESNTLDYKSLGKAGAGPRAAEGEADPKDPEAVPAEKDKPLTDEEKAAFDDALSKLKTGNIKERQAAEDAIAKMGPKVFDRLEKELQGSKEHLTSAFLMSSMKRVDAKRAVKPIVAQASNDANTELTRQAAVVMLGELG